MIERPDEPHPLVEIFLRERRARGDLAVERAEPVEQLRTFGPAGERVRRRRRRSVAVVRLREAGLSRNKRRGCKQTGEDRHAHGNTPQQPSESLDQLGGGSKTAARFADAPDSSWSSSSRKLSSI